MPAPSTLDRLCALRARVLRARAQAQALEADVAPMFREDLAEITQQLTATWGAVSAVIEPMIPPGANDTDEDIQDQQKAHAAELRRLQRADAMTGLLE